MKALSLTQPWATLVVTGAKRFETRSWGTKYRGPLLIHAAKKFPEAAKLFAREEFTLGRLAERFFRGAIIGRVVLKNVYWAEELSPELSALERRYGDYSQGRLAWELTDAVMFEQPIPWRGALGLFEIGDELTGTADDQIWGGYPAEQLRAAVQKLERAGGS